VRSIDARLTKLMESDSVRNSWRPSSRSSSNEYRKALRHLIALAFVVFFIAALSFQTLFPRKTRQSKRDYYDKGTTQSPNSNYQSNSKYSKKAEVEEDFGDIVQTQSASASAGPRPRHHTHRDEQKHHDEIHHQKHHQEEESSAENLKRSFDERSQKKPNRESQLANERLRIAAERGDVSEVRRVLSGGFQADVDYREPNNRMTPLHLAAKLGFKDVAATLLGAGADFEIKSKEGASALYYAAEGGHKGIVQLLVEGYGARVDSTFSTGATPLVVACEKGHLYIAGYLLKKGADPNIKGAYGHASLHIAALSDKVEMIRLLLRFGADVDIRGSLGETPLYVAARAGHIESVRVLVEEGSADLEAVTDERGSSLYVATEYGRFQVVQYLVNRGAYLESAFMSGATPLLIAAQKGFKEITEFLLKQGAHADVAGQGSYSALHLACMTGHVEVVRLLLDAGADVDWQALKGETALILAASAQQSVKSAEAIILALLRHGADYTLVNNAGQGPRSLAPKSLIRLFDGLERVPCRLVPEGEIHDTRGHRNVTMNSVSTVRELSLRAEKVLFRGRSILSLRQYSSELNDCVFLPNRRTLYSLAGAAGGHMVELRVSFA